MIEEVAPGLPELERVIYFDTDDWQGPVDGGTTISDEMLERRESSLSSHDAINIQYTSGTTGFPKGATLSHRSILNVAHFVGDACAYDENDWICIPVPFYHCFGMVMGNLACSVFRSTMVIPGPTFDAGQGAADTR